MKNNKLTNERQQILINVVKEAKEIGINLNEILSANMVTCLELLMGGKTYGEISSDLGITRERVRQLLTGPRKSALSIIRVNLVVYKKHLEQKQQSPNLSRDEIIYQIKSVSIDELYSAIDRLKKPALMNIYREIMNRK
ncbi:hypothetical protein [Paenibacillus amylolyticus]|uniref:RNA polymerase sigma-70 region 4 domain-containing protein n=1 Tax=Paenibacillus amylolyticus TaxID=1451 RepID=A0ABD8B2S6_PAEAM